MSSLPFLVDLHYMINFVRHENSPRRIQGNINCSCNIDSCEPLTLFVALPVYCLLVYFSRCLGNPFCFYYILLPDRPVKVNNELILSPADGRIVAIEETYEDEYFHDKRLQVSVFMSIYDVHCNRYPFSGKVKYVKHHPGKYFIASHPKSSVYNERTSVVIERADGLCVMLKQIAGAVARRIVNYSKEGEEITQGKELGFIKFGSRVDIFLPAGAVTGIKMNQQVYANKNIIAKIKYDHLA